MKKISLLQCAGKCLLFPEKVQSSSNGSVDKDGDSAGLATRFDALA